MKTTLHKVTHHYQPTNNTCGYSALSTLLSYYNIETTPEAVTRVVPQPEDESGESFGSITSQLVTWVQSQGLQAHMYSFDFEILDLSWQGYSSPKLIERLKAIKDVRELHSLGKYWTKVYIEAYIAMLEAGSKLTIQPHVTSKLLYELLQDGPIFANICSTQTRGLGRSVTDPTKLRQAELDDLEGRVWNHSIVIYGNDEKGNFLVADPWLGRVTMDVETMLCGITAAQIECDTQIFVIEGEK